MNEQTAVILAIDPGASGAIVALGPGGEIFGHLSMPTYRAGKSSRVNAQALAGWIRGLNHPIQHAYLEAVGAMPGQGVSSMFSFGHAAGVVEGVIAAIGLPTTLVPPATWKKTQGLIGKDKDAARARAARLYPGERVFDLKGRGQAVADAVFIGLHGIGLKNDLD